MADQTEEMDLGAMARRLAGLNEQLSLARKKVEESKELIERTDKQLAKWSARPDRQR